MFTIITGNDAHYLPIVGFISEGWASHGSCTAMVEVSVHDHAAPARYEFRSLLCREDKTWELITGVQLNERRASLGVEITDKALGHSVYVVEWSAAAREAYQMCIQVTEQMRGLLALGIFDLPETK
mgnify:FL=1